jgi:DNA-binding NarL/FixJ family response regulator
VFVLDLDVADSLNVLKQLAAENLETRVVLLAMSLDQAVMLEVVRLGVKGILLKTMSPELLVRCVRKVHRGGTWVEKVSMGRAVDHIVRQEAGLRATAALLSRRELDIVQMAIAGWSNRQIAEKTAIAEGTVKAHLHNVYEKLGLNGRLELVLYAREKGFL